MTTSLLDMTYGAFPGMNAQRYYGAVGGPDVGPGSAGAAASMDPSKAGSPSSPAKMPDRPIADDPGAGVSMGLSPASLLENPTTWLIVTIAAAVALARYAATGSVL